MLIFVHRSSGRSFSCRRAATGISSVCACLSIASSAIRDRVRDHLDRAAEVQRADDDRAASRVAAEQRTAQGDQHRQAQARPGLVRVHRAHLDRELVLARIAVADQLLRARVEVLLADLDALAKGGRRRLVEDLDAAAGPAGDFDPVEARARLAWSPG